VEDHDVDVTCVVVVVVAVVEVTADCGAPTKSSRSWKRTRFST